LKIEIINEKLSIQQQQQKMQKWAKIVNFGRKLFFNQNQIFWAKIVIVVGNFKFSLKSKCLQKSKFRTKIKNEKSITEN